MAGVPLGQNEDFVPSWIAIVNRNTMLKVFSLTLKMQSQELAAWIVALMIDGLSLWGLEFIDLLKVY